MKNYDAVLGGGLATAEKNISDGYKVVLPAEMYSSYEAYNGSSLDLGNSANVTNAQKSSTVYYQPVADKDFDFVINPVIVEPVIQVMYELKLVIYRDSKAEKTTQNYLLITPGGEVKTLNLKP